MKYIIIPLICMFFLFLVGGLINNPTFSTMNSADYDEQTLEETGLINGTETASLSLTIAVFTFQIDAITGIIGIVIGLALIVGALGFKVMDSGFSEYTQKVVFNVMFFYGIWALLTVLDLTLINMLPINSGYIILVVFTLMYSFGIMKEIK